jgi:CO/xanthine dehydrogenase Mo-binding subunit
LSSAAASASQSLLPHTACEGACAGAYIAEVEIDRETGNVALVRFTGADAFGRIVNPMIVEGQVFDSGEQPGSAVDSVPFFWLD